MNNDKTVIVQIAPVVEYTDKRMPEEAATVYGLGADGLLYYWNRRVDEWKKV